MNLIRKSVKGWYSNGDIKRLDYIIFFVREVGLNFVGDVVFSLVFFIFLFKERRIFFWFVNWI